MKNNGASPGIAIYPGTFDPLTNGHVSLIRRGCEVFGRIIVAVAADTGKSTCFSLEERLGMTTEAFAGDPLVTVESFAGLLVDYADRRGVKVLLRGLRATSEFDYEFQLALMNRKMRRHIQTVFLMTDYQWMYVSSTTIKASARCGGDVRALVPDRVFLRLREKFGVAALDGETA
ncbi:MAG: pantetheine-phosphate adenylyltransferase [Deltaproteobacteria bacterium]|jgi:pantetheine-phosphate adenylyltransferase|nr:pantetheine-phosphate adenylyltransferase [Deltaproteobacteria bacterium]